MNAVQLQAPRQQHNGFDVQRVTPAIREQVATLRVLSGREQATPMSHRDIALMVGVSASTVGHLLRGTYDTHLQNTRTKMQARKAAAALAKKTQAQGAYTPVNRLALPPTLTMPQRIGKTA